jgi:cytoskeletal protein RodZ
MANEVFSGGSLGQLTLELKNERVKRNMSIDDIGRLVDISAAHIEKLEEGDFSFLPPLYVFFYLKKYAVGLGLGDQELLARCRRELQAPDIPFINQASASGCADEPVPRKDHRTLVISSVIFLLLLAAALLARAF